ncbi:hypothetical protein GF361_01035 [Candidatus Woesearchaeota archaeon]|nr:hypothetical protein [Candidatus Woesearchaeota archaeon]
MKIKDYDFGKINIDGKIYENDVIIFPDHIKDEWWREQGHLLQTKDLKEVFKEKPKKLIIGTGYSGKMEIDDKVKQKADELKVELIIKKSTEACKTFNKEKDAVLAVHLTC